jgi:hypothetical protein
MPWIDSEGYAKSFDGKTIKRCEALGPDKFVFHFEDGTHTEFAASTRPKKPCECCNHKENQPAILVNTFRPPKGPYNP